MCNKSECTASEQPCAACVRLYGNRSPGAGPKGSHKPHKNAEVIKAWADGQEIEYLQGSVNGGIWVDWRKGWTSADQVYIPFCDAQSPYRFRVKPVYPTLGKITQTAWYAACRDGCEDSTHYWDFAAAAVKAAIASGEHS